MDPRFQQQNNLSPNPGPNLYPILPPVQHYPQRYPQNYSSQNPACNAYQRSGGYVLLANDKNGSHKGVNAEKMREQEKGLESCFIKCYQSWLWLTIIFCGMSVFKTFVTLLSTTEQPNSLIFTYVSLIYTIWAIIQSVFGIQAINQKNLTKANITCWMMAVYVKPSFFATIWLIVVIADHMPDPNDDSAYFWEVSMYTFLIGAILNTLLGVFVNLVGAFKVRRILSEMNAFQERINISEDSVTA